MDLDENDDYKKVALSVKMLSFTESSTMHGLRYIFSKDSHWLRRLLWTLLVLAGLGYCTYIVYLSFSSYFSYPSIVKRKEIFETESRFPAVTICDYNMLLRSELTSKEFKAMEVLYGSFISNTDLDLSQFDHLNVTDFITERAQFYQGRCTYKNKICPEKFFTTVITDFGLCLKFDPSTDKKYMNQNNAGETGGFDYTDTAYNETEWSFGPNMFYQGFRAALHPPGTRMYKMKNEGHPLLPGYSTDLKITREEVTLLPPPHGQCGSVELAYFSDYSKDNCLLECETNHTVDVCDCRFFYMPGNATECTISEMADCNSFLMDSFRDDPKIFQAATCNCPQECSYTSYQVDVTITAPAKGWLQILDKLLPGFDESSVTQIKIFYQELSHIEVKQEVLYDVQKLLCDIGGAGGLLLGISVATMIEFVDLIIHLLIVLAIPAKQRHFQKTKIEALTNDEKQMEVRGNPFAAFSDRLSTNKTAPHLTSSDVPGMAS